MTEDAGNLIAVYIDNSMSMQSQSSEVSLLEDARASARGLVRNISPSQRFVLLTNSREIGNEYPMNRDEMLMCIDGMKTEAGPLAFNELCENLQMIMRRNGFKSSSLFLYSDFQENMLNLNGIVIDSAIQIVAFPLVSDFQQNVYIDTVWLSSPILQAGLSNEVNVKIVNESEKEIKGFPVNLEIDNHAVAFATVDIPAGGKAEAKMQFVLDEPGRRTAKVSINDFPITFDDSYYFILDVRPVIKIVELTDGQTVETHRKASQILFSNDSLFVYKSIAANRIDQQYFDDCQMVVVNDRSSLNETLWQTILDFAEDGGSVVIFPEKDEIADTNTLNVNLLASQHEFFDDVFANIPDNADYPKVFKHTQMKKEFSNSLTLIGLQNGDPLVTLSRVGSGNVFVFSTRLDSQWTDLAENALFVPLMMKMAMLGGSVGRLSYTIGVDNDLRISDVNAAFDGEIRIRDDQNSMEVIPAVERRGNKSVVRLYEQLPNAGFYDLCKGDEIIDKTAWNDNRIESKMSFYDRNDIDKLLKDNGLNVLSVMNSEDLHSDEMIDVLVRKSMLWKSFILLSLIAMLMEILIIRFWK